MPDEEAINWKIKGDEYVKSQRLEEAVQCYEYAVHLDPEYLPAWNNLGYSLSKLGRNDEAGKIKQKINKINKIQKSKGAPPDSKKADQQEYHTFRGLLERNNKPLIGLCDGRLYISSNFKFVCAYFIDLSIVFVIFSLIFSIWTVNFGFWMSLFIFCILGFIYFSLVEITVHKTIGHALFGNYLVDHKSPIMGGISNSRIILKNIIKTAQIVFFIPYLVPIAIQDTISGIRYHKR